MKCWPRTFPCIGHVRGLGAIMALEPVKDPDARSLIAPRMAGYSRSVAVIPMVRGLNVQAFCCGEGDPAGLLVSACPSA